MGNNISLRAICLEGSTERSDGNRVRSARIGEARTICLEFSCKRAQSRTCSGYAERSRKSRRSGSTERSDGNRGRSPREEAIALILPGRQYATGPASIIHPPPCISVDSCDRPGRHLIHCIYSCQFVRFVGKNISRHFRCTRKRQLQVVPSCSRCRHISPSLH